jgi:uncharacterized protein (DUF983 family)
MVFIPVSLNLVCPRCRVTRMFVNLTGTLVQCSGCSFSSTLATQAPTGAATALLALGGTAITVAAGGASFTAGMQVLYDTGALAEILTVGAGATGTNIPVSAALKAHLTGATFGQLAFALTYGATVAAGYGTEQVQAQYPLSPNLTGG